MKKKSDKNKKPRKEVVKAPPKNKNRGNSSSSHRSLGCSIVNSLVNLARRPIRDFFSSSVANKEKRPRCFLRKKIIDSTANVAEDLAEWIGNIEKRIPQLIATVSKIFISDDERREFYLFRFLSNVPTNTHIYEFSDGQEDQLKFFVSKDVIIDIVTSVKRITKKNKSVSTTTQEKDHFTIRLFCPPKKKCAPYSVIEGKLSQTKYGSNASEKYVIVCLYALARFVRNTSDSRIIVINCPTQSIYKEIMSNNYYGVAIRHKFKCIVVRKV